MIYKEELKRHKFKKNYTKIYNYCLSYKLGRNIFTSSKCPVDSCTITPNRDTAKTADLILYKDHYIPTGVPKHPTQLYMLYFLECPYHTQHIKFPDVFNWTSTYR